MEVGPPSNVTIRMKVVANPGRSFATAIGLAVPCGLQGVSKAEDWESRSSRSSRLPCRSLQSSVLQGSGRLVPLLGGTNRIGTTKERTGKTRHQQCPLLVEGNALPGGRVSVVI